MTTNFEIISAHYAASDRGDLAGMLAPLTPQTRWTEAAGFPCAGTYTGPDEVRLYVFEALARDFDDYRFTLDEIRDSGDVQIGIGTYSGIARSTGRPFVARVAHIWRLSDGKVTQFEQITDSAMVQRALV